MQFDLTIGTSLNATTNPAPADLVSSDPFNDLGDVSDAWKSQGIPLIQGKGLKNGDAFLPLFIDFQPATAGASFSIRHWIRDKQAGAWTRSENSDIVFSGGARYDLIVNPGLLHHYFQILSISTGTLNIYGQSDAINVFPTPS